MLYPKEAVLYLAGSGELSWDPRVWAAPHFLPHRTCPLSPSLVEVNDPAWSP